MNKRATIMMPWILGGMVMTIPLFMWIDQGGSPSSPYSVFPLLGLWAWSLMWTHYMYGTLRLLSDKFPFNHSYKKVSEYLVLAFILLHPGLLIYKLWADTGQYPPESYMNYVGEGSKLFLLMGTVALLCFLAYEVLSRLRRADVVQRVWRWVSLSQAIAMTLIFIHGLALGRHLYGGWFQAYWVLLGCLLIPCFAVILHYDWTKKPS